MTHSRALSISAVFAALCLASSASAQTIFTAVLTNAAEGAVVPTLTTANGGGPRAASFGTATFVLNQAQDAMTFTATVFNIDFTGLQTVDVNDNLGNAHIHAGPAFGPPTFPVVWGFIGTPFNDNNPNDVVVTPFTTGVGGTVSGKWDALEGNGVGINLTSQLPNIFAGRSYINFHTTQFPGGEVRGVLVVAPEPASVVLMTCGLFGLALAARSRRKHHG